MVKLLYVVCIEVQFYKSQKNVKLVFPPKIQAAVTYEGSLSLFSGMDFILLKSSPFGAYSRIR